VSALRREAYTVTTPDGVVIAVQESGNPDGYEVVFIHGFSMGQLCWSRQVESELARTCRLVSYDLRGHGSSGKPLAAALYREGRRWADELKTVLDRAALRRPVLVAWSYGGRIVNDYLACHGPERLAGLNLVSSRTNSDPAFVIPAAVENQQGMASPDLATSIRHTVAFVESCAARWNADAFLESLAVSMVVPHEVRAALMGRPLDMDVRLGKIEFPVLFSHGARDAIIPAAAAFHGRAVTPRSALSIYESSGHSPFMEDAVRFNAELRDFVTRCNR
jgi:pimeloyl-ACP methyl ester carboxylesterase